MDVGGVEVVDLPDGWTGLEVVAAFKCLNEDGEVCYVVRTSDALQGMEAVGMLRAACRQQEDSIADMWRDEDE